jgi:hypothetical protein
VPTKTQKRSSTETPCPRRKDKTLGTDFRLYADRRRIASVKNEEDHDLHRDFAVAAAKTRYRDVTEMTP